LNRLAAAAAHPAAVGRFASQHAVVVARVRAVVVCENE